MSRKPVIATASLAGCFGCHMSFLDIDERLMKLIELVEFNKSPLNDLKKFTKPVDIGLIEGGCCTDDNVEVLRYFRKNCRILVSVGECAITGGVPSMRNSIPVKECLEEAFMNSPTVAPEDRMIPNDEDIPILLDKVYPCHEVVKIDHFIPGCPPSAEAIWEAIVALLDNRPLKLAYDLIKFD